MSALTDWQMAMALGFRGAVQLAPEPIYERRRPIPVTDDEARRWVKARSAGMTLREMSARFGRPICTIQNHIDRLNGHSKTARMAA